MTSRARILRTGSAAVAIAAAVSGPVLLTAGTAAADTCDAYSQHCAHHVPGVPVTPHTPPTTSHHAEQTLPFTGAEVALMGIAGVGAIGVGGGMLVASRKRRRQSA
jgi:LPXTG-motif cell wall-anchored protein